MPMMESGELREYSDRVMRVVMAVGSVAWAIFIGAIIVHFLRPGLLSFIYL